MRPAPTSVPVPTPALDTQRYSCFRQLEGPRRLIVIPTPTFYYLVNLNTKLNLYDVLNLTPAQEDAIRHLRCVPAVPWAMPYSSRLAGFDERDAAGIPSLDDIVEAGIMSEQEINAVPTTPAYRCHSIP